VKNKEDETIYPNWISCENLKNWKSTVDFLSCSEDIEELTIKVNGLLGISKDGGQLINLVALDDIVSCREVIFMFIVY